MNLQVIKNRIRKILIYTITGALFVMIGGILLLQVPAVQESLIKRYLGNFSELTGFKTSVEGFQLLWFDRLELIDVNVYDPANNRMIGAKTIVINFRLSHLLQDRDINIDAITLENAHVLLTKVQESDTSRDLNINIFVNEINKHYGGTASTGNSPRINIGEAILTQSKFSYIDQYRDSIEHGFNYNQFTLDVDEGQLQNFLILGDTTQFNVRTLLATDQKTNFKIRQLSTFFRLCQQSMEFVGLNLHAGESTISDTVIFTFNGQRELSDFVGKVNIHANLQNTIVQPKDLALFAPEANRLTEPLFLSGVFDGRIDNFKFTNMEVGTGNTILRGALDMEGLPDLTETFIILDLKQSKIDFTDFAFVLKDKVLQRLTPLGRVTMDGQFLGYPNDFVAKGQFAGMLGDISSDINFKVNEKDFDRSVYSGKLGLRDFDLGRYLKDTTNFQIVNLNGNVKGSGLTLKTADFTLNGNVHSIGIRNYNYKNIVTNARFASQLFNGYFKIDDPNLQFSALGSIDLREKVNSIKIQAKLDTAFLHNLKLTDEPIFLHSDIDLNIKGLHLDSITGMADLRDFRIWYNNKWLTLQNIHLNAQRFDNERALQLKTTLIDAETKGNFLLSDLSRDIQRLVQEIILNIQNDEQAIAQYYGSDRYRPKSYQTDFNIHIKNLDPILKLLNVDLLVSNNTAIEGKFTSGYTSILQAYTRFDSLSYNKSLLLNTEVELTASKIADSTSVLAMALVNSKRQILTPALRTKDMALEAIWNRNHVDFSFDADQDDQANYIRLKGAVDFMEESTQIRVLPSTLHLLDKDWEFDAQNYITIYKQNIDVHDLIMRNEKQMVAVDGTISNDPKQILGIQIKDFDLSSLNPITGRELDGTFNALIDISNFYANPFIQNDIRIDSLMFDKFLIGDITGKNHWDTLDNKFVVDFFVDRNAMRIVNVTGSYNPKRETSPLDLSAKLERANLKILQPFLSEIFSNIGGTVTGDYRITGTLNEPAISGEGNIDDGQLTVNYLKTTYNFRGIIGLSPNSIYFKDIELFDLFKNKARLTGTISHHNFYSMRINLEGAFENFHLLNTTERDNSLFNGTGFATGDFNLFGPIANLKITANIRTEKNTKINIPIGGDSEVEKKEFIRFVSFTDSTFQKSLTDNLNNRLDLTGITMDLNLDITPDALCQVIYDLRSGDIIRGRGNGELQLQLNTKGEFNMFGPFEFTEGAYNFTIPGFINKEFDIKRGSRIKWFGDAYEGILDISASYRQMASFAPILQQSFSSSPESRTPPQLLKKYPVEVLLKLDGPMLSPDIKFDIVTSELPQNLYVEGRSLAFEFQAFKNKLDEQELNRQVFSLIILKRFSPPESLFGNTSGSFVNSVSELLTNQLSNWMSQVDENLEVDLDLSALDAEAFNTFQLRVAYNFGRLRISREGTIYGSNSNNTNFNNTQANLSSLAGDWTVEYMLTADGKLKVKMYNRTNINPILNTFSSQNSTTTTGASLTHTQSFNRIRDIWQSARTKRKKSPPEKEQEDTDANKEAVKDDNDDGSQ
jgi:hypothetical protein